MGRGVLHPWRKGRGQVQGLPAAASVPQASCPMSSTTRSNGWPRSTETGMSLKRSPRVTTVCCASTCRRKPDGESSVAERTHEWPLDNQGRSTRPRDIGEHLTIAVRAIVRQNPSLYQRSSTLWTSRLSATVSGTSTRPSSPRSSRPSPIHGTGSAWPTCSPTSWAAPTSTC